MLLLDCLTPYKDIFWFELDMILNFGTMKVPPGHLCRIDKRIHLTILSKFRSFYKMSQMCE